MTTLKHSRRRRRSLSGHVVAITGGARGIGHATARALAHQGARVAIGDLDGDLADQVATELGGDAFGVGVDVTDEAAFTAFLDGVEHRLGPLYVLVNNAGIMNAGPIETEDELLTARAVAINLEAVIHPDRERQGGGVRVHDRQAAGRQDGPTRSHSRAGPRPSRSRCSETDSTGSRSRFRANAASGGPT